MQTKSLTIFLTTALISFSSFDALSQTCEDYIPDEWQDSRYTDNNNQTITDNTTELMWKKCSEGLSGNDCNVGSVTTHTWKGALDMGGSSFAGYSDWRLPNIKELGTLVKRNCYTLAINEIMFPNTPSSSFWSSSLNANDSDLVWQRGFNYGHTYSGFKGASDRVRLVRLGK